MVDDRDLTPHAFIRRNQAKLTPSEYYALPSIARFVDHIQNIDAVVGTAGAPAPITFDLANTPKAKRVAEVSTKKKEKGAKADANVAANSSTPATTESVPVSSSETPTASNKTSKKDKKAAAAAGGEAGGKKAKASQPASPATAADAGEPSPSMIDLRVGKIIQGNLTSLALMLS